MMANNISLLLIRIWDVSAPTVAGGGFGGVWRLTLLTSALQALGVAGVFMLPTSVRHQRDRQRRDRSSRWGAWVCFYVICVCVLIPCAFFVFSSPSHCIDKQIQKK